MNGAIARIFLRYVVGALFAGSPMLAEKLSTDPDIIMMVAAGVGFAIEGVYAIAKKRGWAT